MQQELLDQIKNILNTIKHTPSTEMVDATTFSFSEELFKELVNKAIESSKKSLYYLHFKEDLELSLTVHNDCKATLSKEDYTLPYAYGTEINYSQLSEIFIDLESHFRIFDNSKCIQNLNTIEIPVKDLLLKVVCATVSKDNLDKNLFILSSHWGDLIVDKEFCNVFDPVSKHELLLNGQLGDIKLSNSKTTVYTDAYEHPKHKFLKNALIIPKDNPGSFNITCGIEYLSDRITINKIIFFKQNAPIYELI